MGRILLLGIFTELDFLSCNINLHHLEEMLDCSHGSGSILGYGQYEVVESEICQNSTMQNTHDHPHSARKLTTFMV